MENNLFPNIVGQESVKRKLAFYLESFNTSGILPHLSITAPKGCGKTTLAKALAKNLKIDGVQKRLLEINCASLGNLTQFWTIVLDHLTNRDVTVLFDESSEIPRDITMALLTILNPNPDNRNDFTFDGNTVCFDFRKLSFLFCTSEPQKFYDPLLDRLTPVELEDYTVSQLSEIMRRKLKNIRVAAGLLEEIATTLRYNARQAELRGTDIHNYLLARNKTEFNGQDWRNIIGYLGILPLGLSEIELRIMKILRERPQTSLTQVASRLGFLRETVQKTFERYLLCHNLIEVRMRGRALTAKGTDYLKSLDTV